VVSDIQAKVKQQVQIPAGYYAIRGQFEAENERPKTFLLFSAIAFVYRNHVSLGQIGSYPMIMINLPLALVGVLLQWRSRVASVDRLAGGICHAVCCRHQEWFLLVDNYNTKFAAGMPLKDLLIQGSMERLNAILMTAFTSALGLAPLVVAGGPGKSFCSPYQSSFWVDYLHLPP